MKKATVKTTKKETDTEMLARLMKQGFDRMDIRFDGVEGRLDKVEGRLDGVEEKLVLVEGRLGHLDREVVGLHLAQDETNRRLTSLERKQAGVLESLDDTVHKKEFRALVTRVKVLEGKR